MPPPVPAPPAPPPDDGARAARVAAAVARATAAAGADLPDGLVIWTLGGGRPAVDGGAPAGTGGGVDAAGAADPADGAAVSGVLDPADALGAVLESATGAARRRAQGLHVTPRWLADHLVGLALPDVAGATGASTLCDPACGGGAFLLAAARRLHAGGASRRDVVRHLLWGADVDPVGLATAEAALALWAGEAPPPGRLVVADPLAAGAAAWPDPPAGGFAAVAGNPPFLSQLGRATARSPASRRRLRARFGPALRPYTDTAWLFLLVGCELARPGGRVVLVQPQSVVAARDAEAVRTAVDERAVLRELWVDRDRVFRAAVRVCAPVLERLPAPAPGAAGAPAVAAGPWSQHMARAVGVPAVHLAGQRTLGERAVVHAGFRDEYYGLATAVREAAPCDAGCAAPLVTSGAIDWASCAWGTRPARFAKRRWRAPVVDLARLGGDGPPAARRWVARTRVPKVVVATQTRVVEAAVDAEGAWVPSVPALAVVPGDPGDLWPLAAALLSPAATAWLALRSAGTGLDRGRLKVAGPDLAALPLPVDAGAWDAAAEALRRHVAAPRRDLLDAYLAAAARAYRCGPTVESWWRRQSRPAVRRANPDG
ncbi:MAG TPA: N-6 DNA methylase [Acidimicrobiales bacterium]